MHVPIILALNFANPVLLWGLGAASIPILIHLLNRRKHREVNWAAMRFLIAAMQRNSRRIRVEQWLLLLVRTLIIVLVVSAMAKPFLESLGALPIIAGRRSHHVLVLDGSLSMGYNATDVSRFEQAKSLAAQFVKDSRRGDAMSIVLMADPPRVVIGDPSPNYAEVLKELEQITLPHGGTDLAASFEAIVRVLDASSIPQKEVVFLTDLQTSSWKRPDGSRDEAFKNALAKINKHEARSVVIDLGKGGEENHAVTDLKLDPPIVTAGNPIRARATLRNFGGSASASVKAQLVVDGQLGPEEMVTVPLGEETPIDFSHTFATPGEHMLEVRIDEDKLKLDNQRWQAIPVREFLRVLLVDGHFKPEPFQAETDFLSQALSPPADSNGSPSAIRAEVVSESQLMRSDLTQFDAVLLCNIAQFTEAEVSTLEEYLKQGGGVVVFGGDQVVRDNYNRLLYADGKGLLPAAIGPNVGNAAAKQASFGLDPLKYAHPLVSDFAGEKESVQASLTGARTYEFHKLTLPKGSMAKVALAFDNGDPAVIEVPRSRGTVIQVATSADTGWTTWPLHQSFPPVMEKIVLEAAAGRLSERNVKVGQPLDQALPGSGAGAAVSVSLPDGRTLPSKLQVDGGVSLLHFEETEVSGPYQVKVGPPLALENVFAANPDPAESDLAKFDRSGLAEALPGWKFAYVTNSKELSRNAGSVSHRGELHRPMLMAVLALLIVESIMAWYFGHHSN